MIRPSVQVREFHATFGAPINDGPATLDIGDRLHLRMSLIAEEFAELVDAVYGNRAGDQVRHGFTQARSLDDGTRDLIETADALGDLEYVLHGMGLETGIPIDAIVTEIHRSNLSKLRADGRPVLRADGKILKGPNFEPPQIAAVLAVDA